MTAIQQHRPISSVERIDVLRDLFQRCFYCGQSLLTANTDNLSEIPGRDRIAHRICPELPAVSTDAA